MVSASKILADTPDTQDALWSKVAETYTKEELESARIASQDQLEGAKLGIEIAKEIMKDK